MSVLTARSSHQANLQTPTLNFLVIGAPRSGVAFLATGLNRSAAVACHLDVFADEPEVRQQAHELYFGPSVEAEKLPEWLTDESNAYRYLTRSIFDCPRNGEQATGACLFHHQVRRFELADLICRRCREGDFCLVLVRRNPVACFISLKQAERLAQYRRYSYAPPLDRYYPTFSIDFDELYAFYASQQAGERRVREACSDRLELSYRELAGSYTDVLARVFEFLEIEEGPVEPVLAKLNRRPLHEQVSNWKELRRRADRELAWFMEPEELF